MASLASSVRVVLPDDTVLRVDITHDIAIIDVVMQRLTANLSNADPTSIDAVHLNGGELVLVRSGNVLEQKCDLEDVVRHNDILEWRSRQEPSLLNAVEVDEQAAQANNSCDQDAAEDRNGGSKQTSPTVNTQAVVVAPADGRLRRKRSSQLLQQSQSHALAVPLVSSHLQRRRPSAHQRDAQLSRFLAREFLLRSGFECLDHLLDIQALSRQLLLTVRDIYARLGANPVSELFPIVQSLATQTCELVNERRPSDSVRWLYPLICRSSQGVELPMAMRGDVDVVEWVALWRNQRKAYACLCHGGVLHLFTSKKQCDEYLFEQAVRGQESNLDPSAELDHKRILKEHAPQSTIDIIASQWSVRKGETAEGEGDGSSGVKDRRPTQRHAFALFDKVGKLKLIMDVKTKSEASQWIASIKREIWLGDQLPAMLASVRSEIPKVEATGSLSSRVASLLGGRRFKVPLWWLHSHGDSVSSGQARVERAKSLTLSQALKDARRDRFQINNVIYSGQCVEEMVGGLLMEITRHAPHLTPMEALQFARLVLVVSSRTQGGGDILDAMRLLIVPAADEDNSDAYCLCPARSETADPVCIEISEILTDKGACVAADIEITMAYRVLSTQQIGGDACDAQDLVEGGVEATDSAEVLSLVGVYRRRLVCSVEDWNRVEGTVEITIGNAGSNEDNKQQR